MSDEEMLRAAIQMSRDVTRRRFLRRSGLALGAVVAGPSFLAACGGDSDSDSDSSGDDGATSEETTTKGSGTADDNDVYHANWTGYLDDETPKLWEEATGLKLFYSEEVNDNNEYFAKIRPELSTGATIGPNIITLTSWITPRFIDLDWLEKIPADQIPNIKNLAPEFADPPTDPTGEYSLPWLSGIGGLAYNVEEFGGELTSAEALFDPKFKGKIGMLTEMRDTIGIVGSMMGLDITQPVFSDFEPVFDKIEQAVADGQIRRFTGNDYLNDLGNGNFVICIGWSGDILGEGNPNLAFSVPDTGGTRWFDTMMIPKGAERIESVAKWMDFVYDPVNSARITAAWPYTSPVLGMQEELRKLGGDTAALADNPLLYPDEATKGRINIFGKLDEEQEALFDARFAEISGS